MKWDRFNGVVVKRYYRATICDGDLPLYAYIVHNGGGWWNACISPSAEDAMMEHPHRMEVPGAETLAGAKENVAAALVNYARQLNIIAYLQSRS